MRLKIKIIAAFLFLLQFSDLKAQLFDHLEPCDVNFLSVSKDSNTKNLISDFDEIAPYLRFIAIPTDSLSVEIAIEISGIDSVGSNNYIRYREYSKDYKKIKKKDIKIPRETTEIFVELFKDVLKGTRYNNTEQVYSGDDADFAFPSKIYYFYEAVTGRTGKTVYPAKGKNLAELISLCENLIDYANNNLALGDLEEKLRNRKILLVEGIAGEKKTTGAIKNELRLEKKDEKDGEIVLPYNPDMQRDKRNNYKMATTVISVSDIKNAGNPKYDFKKNSKNSIFVIFASNLTNPEKADLEFQAKYKVIYSSIGSHSDKYLKNYNKLTFKYLKKKFKKTWQTEIRKDAIGLDDFLK